MKGAENRVVDSLSRQHEKLGDYTIQTSRYVLTMGVTIPRWMQEVGISYTYKALAQELMV